MAFDVDLEDNINKHINFNLLHKKSMISCSPWKRGELLQHSAPLVIQHKNLESYLVIIFT